MQNEEKTRKFKVLINELVTEENVVLFIVDYLHMGGREALLKRDIEQNCLHEKCVDRKKWRRNVGILGGTSIDG